MKTSFDSPDFTLTAITLRGIGSYISGQRLEIKPLTVICGPNGSGKSTWLKALKMLRQSLDEGLLPFQYSDSSEGMLNQFYADFNMDEKGNRFEKPDYDHPFGPPGTIGVEFVTTRSVKLPSSNRRFGGKLAAGTTIAIRMALNNERTRRLSRKGKPGLCEFVELDINGIPEIRFLGALDCHEKNCQDNFRYRKKPTHLFLNQNSRWFGVLSTRDSEQINDHTLIYVGKIDWRNESIELNEEIEYDSNRIPNKICFDDVRSFWKVSRDLLARVLDSCFLVGDIRDPGTKYEPTDFDQLAKEFKKDRSPMGELFEDAAFYSASCRYVGNRGERSWLLFDCLRRFGCRPITMPEFSAAEFPGIMNPTELRIGELGIEFSEYLPDRLADLLNSCFSKKIDAEQLAVALNEICRNTDIDLRAETSKKIKLKPTNPLLTYYENDRELNQLAHRSWSDLNLSEKQNSNFLVATYFLDPFFLTRVDFAVKMSKSYGKRWAFFGDYVSRWMDYLLQTRILTRKHDEYRIDNEFEGKFFTGDYNYRLSTDVEKLPVMHIDRLVVEVDEIGDDDWRQFTESTIPTPETMSGRIFHPCFGLTNKSPENMSSGFHQVFPIVLQICLSAPMETITIENPEVHLHPALLRRLTEFLIENAAESRNMIVETHSDLLVNRVVRALIQEDLPQQSCAINFVELKRTRDFKIRRLEWAGGEFVEFDTPGDDIGHPEAPLPEVFENETVFFAESHLLPIEFDENCRIINWPPGFLDISTDEARRLIDAMMDADQDEVDEPDE